MTNPVTVLPETNLQVLECLHTYRYLTSPQLVRLEVVSHLDSLYRALHRFEAPQKYVNYIELGVLPGIGRLPRVYYLTKHGAEYLADVWRVEPETIAYPKAAKLYCRDFFHRTATTDFEIGLRQHTGQQGMAVEFYHRYFDSRGANRNLDPKDRLQRLTKVPLGDGFFYPDAIFAVSAPNGARFLFALEVYKGIDTGRVHRQLQKHMLALQEGRLSDLYRYDKAHRVLCVFENDSAMQAAGERLLKDPAFTGRMPSHFAFGTLAALQADFVTGWRFWDAARTSIFDVGP